jgi:diguanylate cyclase (GGDEF)-like protein
VENATGLGDARIASTLRVRALLRDVPVFAPLGGAALDRMVEAGRVIQISSGETLFNEGDAGDAMYIVLSGRIRITKRMGERERVLAMRRRNDFLGEMALVDGEPRSASAVAASPTRLFRLGRAEFYDLVLTSRDAVLSLLAGVTERMRRAHETEARLLEELQRKNLELERFNARLERRVRRQTRELRRINRELEALSVRDGLTGLYNRRVLGEMLELVVRRQTDRQRQTSVIMLDVDHFKRLNDAHGHPAGDRVLVEVSRLLRTLARPGQVVARYGGEEFVIVSPGGPRRAAAHAETVRAAIAQHVAPVTVSLGVASHPRDASTPSELIARADAALYRAKAEGRNRVVVHGG